MEANIVPARPSRVTLALYMLYTCLGISVIVVLVSWVRFGLPGWVGYKLVAFLIQLAMFHFWAPIGVMIYGNLIILPVAVWLYFMIGKGKNWARITLLIYVILEILFTIGLLGFSFVMRYHLVHAPSLSDFLMRISPEILQDVFQIVGLTLLFGRASSDWFKAIKNRSQQAKNRPKMGIPLIAVGLLALLVTTVVLYLAGRLDKGDALTEAMRARDMKQVEKLLEKGADVNANDKYGVPPLVRAVGHQKIVKLLLANGAEINARTEAPYAPAGRTALMEASWWGNYDVVKLLLDNGSDINAKDQNGETALMLASWTGKSEIALGEKS